MLGAIRVHIRVEIQQIRVLTGWQIAASDAREGWMNVEND